MPDCNSTAYKVVYSPVIEGQSHGRMPHASVVHGSLGASSLGASSVKHGCQTVTSTAAKQGLGPSAHPRNGASPSTQQQRADTRSATAQMACERVLALHKRGNSDLSASDASVHKLAQYLPPTVFHLLEVLGSAWRLQKLLKAYGGASIRVPAVWAAAENPLRAVLGKRGLKKFMDVYGGTDVYIPRCACFVRRMRDEAILRDYELLTKRGTSLRQAAVKLSARYDLSERQIRTILNTIS